MNIEIASANFRTMGEDLKAVAITDNRPEDIYKLRYILREPVAHLRYFLKKVNDTEDIDVEASAHP